MLIRTLGRCSGRRNNQLVKKLRPAEYCTLVHFHLYLLMPGFHFPHSHFPGIALPKKMSSKIEKAYALLQALFSWEPPRVRVRTGFPEKGAVLTLSVQRQTGDGCQRAGAGDGCQREERTPACMCNVLIRAGYSALEETKEK